ncbi:TnsA endonuclease N-terminal domain-containing protein [Pseudomonas farris]
MSVRKVITRRSCHFRGYFPSLKNGKPMAWESQLEGCFFRLLELSPQVRSYGIQPSQETLTVGLVSMKYFPDLRVFLMDGREWWFEVKPQKKLLIASIKQKMVAAKDHFAASKRNFSVVKNDLIHREPLAKNLQQLMYHRRGPMLSNSQIDEVGELLDLHDPKTFGELTAIFGEMEAWRLLGLGIVGVDLEKTISICSEIFLTGGHRHADIFN